MKKIFLFVIIGLLPLSPRNGASQINAYSVSIEISGIKVIRNCFFSDLQGQTNSFDTMEVAFALSTFPELTLIDTIITSNQSYHGINGDNRSETLNIVLDTNRKKIKNLYAKDYEGHSTFMDSPSYWEENGVSINLSNIDYYVSPKKDTLSVIMNFDKLIWTKISTDKYREQKFPHSGGNCHVARILKFEDNALLKVIIRGSFPLSVSSPTNNKNCPLLIDQSIKTIKLFRPRLKKEILLPCYDILGRKHNLEFLGADENSATYSIRSLKPGVYFVNDGRETVKFIITE